MKKTWYRAAGALLAVLMAVTISSCSGGNSNPSPATGNTSATATDNSAAATDNGAAATDNGAATTGNSATTAAAALTPIDFTIFGGGTDPGTFPEDPVHQYIREKLGVNVKYLYTANDTDTQFNLWLASGDFPDAIRMKAGVDLDNLVSANYAVDLTPYYAKYLPYLSSMMDTYNNPRLFMWDIPGYSDKIWFIPGQLGDPQYPNIATLVGVRWDIWQKLGENGGTMPKPTNLDEYYQMLKQMVAVAPTNDEGTKCYAISGWLADNWGGQWLLWGLTGFGGDYQWTGSATAADDYQQKYCFDSDVWMYAMHFLNNAYRDGIADPEAVTMNQAAYNQKLAQGLIYSTPYSGNWLDGVANTARAAAGHPEQEIVPYTWMTYPSGIAGTSPPITGNYDPTGIDKLCFTTSCKNVEEIIKRLAPLATQEGAALQGMGLEGVNWNYDSNGMRQPTDADIKGYLNDPDYQHKTGVMNWCIFGDYYMGLDSKGDSYNIQQNKYVIASQQNDTEKSYIQFMNLDPNISIEANAARSGGAALDALWQTTDLGVTGTPLDDIKNQLNSMESEYIGKLYVAKTDAEFDSLVAEWKQKCENINYMDYYNQINPIIKADYDAYLAQQGK